MMKITGGVSWLVAGAILNGILGLSLAYRVWSNKDFRSFWSFGEAAECYENSPAQYTPPTFQSLIRAKPRQPFLTHVVMPYHPRQEQMVKDNLLSWIKYAPCPAEGQDLNRGIRLVLFPAAETDMAMDAKMRKFYHEEIPANVRGCFGGGMEVRFAALGKYNDNYLIGTRLMFEQLFDIPNARYIFYMEPDARPIRDNWLSAVEIQARSPEPFWVKGSIFRGTFDIYAALHNFQIELFCHINGNSIYNVGDPIFRAFYFDLQRPWMARIGARDLAYDTDMPKFLFQRSVWKRVGRKLISRFRFSEFIQNHWHSDWSLEAILSSAPSTFLIHGGTQRP